MALALYDRVKETTTTVGTGSVTLLGATTGFQSFAVVGNANTTYYCIADQGGANWEVGIGTYTASGTTLARTTVLSSSNADALVTFTAGVKDVFVTYPSSKGLWKDASGNAIGLGTPASGVVTNLTGTASININGTVGATTATTGAFTTLAYTGTLTGGTGVVAIGTNQIYKDASGNVGIGTSSPTAKAQIGDSTVVTTNRLVFGKAQTATESNLPAIGQQSAGVGNDLALAATSTSANVRFYTGASTNSGEIGTGSNAERMRIDSSGNVTLQKNISVGAAAPTTVGTGITFPAAVDVSSNANTLDDYEEGTWTPTYVNFTITSGTSEARYTKVGRVITANIWINATSVSCLTNATFTLPIAAVSYSAGSAVSSTAVSGIQITGSTTGVVRVAIAATGNLALTVTYQLAS